MKRDWRVRLAALMMSAALVLPALAEAPAEPPAAAEEAFGQVKVEESGESAEPETPEETGTPTAEPAAVSAAAEADDAEPTAAPSKPEKDEDPEATDAPETTDEPEITDAPEETEVPEETDAPEITDAPEETEVPETTDAPMVTDDPEATEVPGTTDAPEVTETPDPTDSPETTATPEGSAAPEATEPALRLIVSVTPLAVSERTVSEKPAYEQVIAALPGALEVQLSDSTVESVPVAWSCADYESDAEIYVFTASLTVEGYALIEGVVLPPATLYVEKPAELSYGDFTLSVGGDGLLTVIGYAGKDDAVSIPAEVDGGRVISIASSAFAGNREIREIAVPDGVISIEGGAFSGCERLEKISLPDSLEQVGGGLFADCDELEFVQLNISGETAVENARGYVREIVEFIDGEEVRRTVEVTLDEPFTDFCVLDGGRFTVEGALRVDEEHSLTVSSGGAMKIAEGGSIVVFGALASAGDCANEGTVVACAGSVSGVGGNVVTDHAWSDGRCDVCGARQHVLLDVDVLCERFEKTYDGASGVDIAAEDFALSGVRDDDEVYIAAINVDFGGKDVGNYLTSVEFVLGGEHAQHYGVKQVEIGISILPKRVTVSPRAGQGKAYGDADPVLSAGYRGTVKGEALQGALSREKGEAAGSYRILSGTLDRLNPNYEIVLEETYFEISAKSLSDSSISAEKLSNQRYTGDAIEPSVEVWDGSTLLREGADYEVSYSDNVSVGTATATVSGVGNYTGSRSLSFQIIRVSSGSEDSGLGGSGTSSSTLDALNDFGSASELGLADESELSVNRLTVEETDLGEAIFDEFDQPRTFVQSQRLLAEGEDIYSLLTISVDELLDEFEMPLEGEYGQPRMRLTMDMIHAIAAAGYTHIELIVGEAEARIPLSTLYAEFVSVEGALRVDCYEVRLWPIAEEELSEPEQLALAELSLCMQPVRFELVALPLTDGNAPSEPQDVLTLLDGVKLMLAPEIAPDYENASCSVICVDAAGVPQESERAMFVLDGEQVKSMVHPAAGGMYALAAE